MNFSKLVLNGTDNNGIRHRYSFEKTYTFKKGFVDFMESLGFEKEKELENRFFYKYENDKGEEVIKELKPSDFQDVVWFFQNKQYEVDVFWGSKKVVLLVRTNQKTQRTRRKNMLKELESKANWISEQEKKIRLEKIRGTNKKLRINNK